MTAKDKNNKTIREADWISYGGRVYQIDSIVKKSIGNSFIYIGVSIHFRFVKSKKKVIKVPNFWLSVDYVTKVDPPIAYNITDNG